MTKHFKSIHDQFMLKIEHLLGTLGKMRGHQVRKLGSILKSFTDIKFANWKLVVAQIQLVMNLVCAPNVKTFILHEGL